MIVFSITLLSMHKGIHKMLCKFQPGAVISAKLTKLETLYMRQLFCWGAYFKQLLIQLPLNFIS